MDNIENQIVARIVKISILSKDENWNDSQWTKGVKRILVEIGKEFGWMTAAHGCKTDESKEWLYDVVWFQSDKADHMTEVRLVAECEWGKFHAIKEDFEKLLVARSKYRVMIFQEKSEADANNLIEQMKMWITKFKSTKNGDRYLFIGWTSSSEKWIYQSYVEK